MRDILLFAIVFGLLPFMLKRPVIGIFAFTWISLMNPHRLTYGAAYEFPFAALIAVVTLVGVLLSKEPKRFPLTPVTLVLLAFIAWMTFTSFFALEPQLVWKEWDRVMKTLFIALLAMAVIHTEKDIKIFAAVTGLSLGFYGLKGGAFTLGSGGSSHVLGPEGSYITDNNALALALITAAPIIWFLQLHAHRKWLRIGLGTVAVLTIVAAAGSYSRGALLAGAAMLTFLWLKSRHKLRVGIVLILLVPLIFSAMPDKWFDRMGTIDNYTEDASALGRINAWYFAANVAKDNILGGGYNVFTHKMFFIYAPVPLDHHAAHSIYFQVLGEHGYIGLALFLLLMACAWRSGTRIVRYCRNRDDLKWASDLAAMCQVSIIGYAVGGAFLSLAYYDLYYELIALLVLLEKVIMRKPDSARSRIAASPMMLAPAQGEGGKSP
ncbi:putative O-glycosylation ligase, exosortase A system-associated [Noviherbaspirillum cavernae]|nr:putative O-glycosylation ligase, exosortase A system-associated [Noviherbaspirillum cavernae]